MNANSGNRVDVLFQLSIIINIDRNFKRYKCKCLCFVQNTKCLSEKVYASRESGTGNAETGAAALPGQHAATNPHPTQL